MKALLIALAAGLMAVIPATAELPQNLANLAKQLGDAAVACTRIVSVIPLRSLN